MAQYPQILAGQRITAAQLTSMMPVEIYKLSNTDRASTVTLTDDPELTYTLEANAVYRVEAFLHYAAISAAGFQAAWTVPSGATGNRSALGAGSTQVSSDNVSGRFGVHAYGTAADYGDRASASNQMFAYEESILTTSSAGTLAVQWAQSTSNATASRLAAGSSMRIKRLA